MQELSPLNLFLKKTCRRSLRLIAHSARTASFQGAYLLGMALFLVLTTVVWSWLGARVQVHNADQLSDPYLFSSWATFHGATFPSAHTFLLKWPIFWLLNVFGISSTSLAIATTLVTLCTILVLMYILSRIVRRPLLLGTLYAVLAFVLLLIPAQSYSGALLPVNMAMLTTRNLEYAVYLVALIAFIRTTRVRSLSFVAGVLVLAILVASDKLFLAFSLGGAGLALAVYALLSNWRMVAFSARWLLGSVLAALGGTLLLTLIATFNITHFSGGSSVSPYAAGTGAKELALGVVYAINGLFTNFGANPAYDNRVISQLPSELASGFTSLRGVLYLAAAVILAGVLLLTWRLLHVSFRKTSADTSVHTPAASQLSIALLCSSAVAFGVYIATNHYYAVDARYLAITFFAGCSIAATMLRRRHWRQPKWLVLIGFVFVGASIFATGVARSVSSEQVAAFAQIDKRNDSVVQALKRHPVDVLVGDYWRVLPIKFADQGKSNILPLAACTTPYPTLTSKAWQPDLAKHSFAYLITLDGSLTNYPSCTLPQITKTYGRPNSIQIIAGSAAHPKEALVFYDAGSHPLLKSPPPQPNIASLLPVSLDQLGKTNCMQSTVMNVVAHQDDDLLFLSPDLLHELDTKNCVRTVFMTAGDSGYGKFYWLSRQLGAEAAYSTMLGIRNLWDQQTLVLAPGQYVTVATPRDSNRVSLIFLNLPDGNLQGEGFADSDQQSLAKLRSGTISSLRAVDGQSNYTSDQLVQALAQLMTVYQPAAIHTQADVASDQYPDHSDHIATGQFALAAAGLYNQQHFGGVINIPVIRYVGYPIRGYESNISGTDLVRKEAAFFAYAQHDGGVCNSVAQCASVPTYDAYLSRQYQEDPAQL
jgi:LmbE family N-acetylglucosaminyl deacetylase